MIFGRSAGWHSEIGSFDAFLGVALASENRALAAIGGGFLRFPQCAYSPSAIVALVALRFCSTADGESAT